MKILIVNNKNELKLVPELNLRNPKYYNKLLGDPRATPTKYHYFSDNLGVTSVVWEIRVNIIKKLERKLKFLKSNESKLIISTISKEKELRNYPEIIKKYYEEYEIVDEPQLQRLNAISKLSAFSHKIINVDIEIVTLSQILKNIINITYE